MGELVVASCERRVARRIAREGVAFRIRRGDQTQLAVEDAEEVREVSRAVLIAGGFKHLLLRSHVAFDVAAEVRQQ